MLAAPAAAEGEPAQEPPPEAPAAGSGDASPAPETRIVRAPAAVAPARVAHFAFESDDADAAFECSIDDGPFLRCPPRVRYSKLNDGAHVFRVRAVTDVAADESPAEHRWTVDTRPRVFPLSRGHTTRWAPVARRVVVRARPSAAARRVAQLETRTPEATTNLVVVLERTEAEGRLWVRVRLPILPNNQTGWVPRSALGGYTAVTTRLVVDRDRQEAMLFRRGKVVWRARAGVGAPWSPTPKGEFYVRVRIDSTDPFYGPVAFGTSARSYVRTEWPGGGFIGIHGTSLPHLIPGRVSNGCVRLRNDDALRLARLLPVGTPVTIR
ncbi:MAG TPA: L,D-transpeptidase [Gaiellaceae bacterium]|nr:L,D-transpeptidase [Gaiellaceae bacterium]